MTYNWISTEGADIASGQGTNSIHINYTESFLASGTLSVKALNACGNSTARTLSLTRNNPLVPGTITGSSSICAGSTGNYSVGAITGVTSYNWAVPTGSVVQSGQGTRTITVLWGTTSGNISVYASNACGNSGLRTKAITVNACAAKLLTASLNEELFPNPSNGKVTVKFARLIDGNYFLVVNDITGRVILKEKGNARQGMNLHEIDLSGHAKGMYMVSINLPGYSKQLKLILK